MKISSSRTLLLVVGCVSVLLIAAGVALLVRQSRRHADTLPRPSQTPSQPVATAVPPAAHGTAVPAPLSTTVADMPAPEHPKPTPTPADTSATADGVPNYTEIQGFAAVKQKYPIFVAAITGNLAEARKIVQQNPAAVRAREPGQDATPLQWAVAKRQQAMAVFLLTHGAAVDACGKNGWTALHSAAYLGDAATVRLLLDHGAKINAVDHSNGTALLKAIGRGHVAVAKLLLDHRPAVNIQEKDHGLSALHEAVLQYSKVRDDDLIRRLLAQGAIVQLKDRGGMTPLMYAQMTRQPALIALLKRAGRR